MSQGHGEHSEWYYRQPAVYRFLRRVVNCGCFTRPIGEYLQAAPAETVIDVGCGVGEFARLVPGSYEGYDLNGRFVEYAQKKFGSSNRRFYQQNVLELPQDKKPYDKGLIVNILHHFDDVELDRLLARLKLLVSKYFVIVDADWDASNRFQRWLLGRDQGSYLRPRRQLLDLLSRHFEIHDFDLFRSRSGSVCLFRSRGVPKNGS